MIPFLLFYIVCWGSIIPWIGSQQGATEAKCSTLYNILKRGPYFSLQLVSGLNPSMISQCNVQASEKWSLQFTMSSVVEIMLFWPKCSRVFLCVWERHFNTYISKHLNVIDGSCCFANNDLLPSRFLSLVSVFTYASYSAYLTCNHPGFIQTQWTIDFLSVEGQWGCALLWLRCNLSFLRPFKWTFEIR